MQQLKKHRIPRLVTSKQYICSPNLCKKNPTYLYSYVYVCVSVCVCVCVCVCVHMIKTRKKKAK
jgi:hypothetical protein